MIIKPCTCNPMPLHSSRQDEAGCVLIDGIDEEGSRHHGYQLPGKKPCWLTIVVASPSEQMRQNKVYNDHIELTLVREAKEARRIELKEKMKTSQLSLKEMQELLMMLV